MLINVKLIKKICSGKNAEEIEVKLLLSKLKPLHAGWLIELYKHFTPTVGKEIITNGQKAAGITDAIKNGFPSFDLLDPFSRIDPLEQSAGDEQRTNPSESSTDFESDHED